MKKKKKPIEIRYAMEKMSLRSNTWGFNYVKKVVNCQNDTEKWGGRTPREIVLASTRKSQYMRETNATGNGTLYQGRRYPYCTRVTECALQLFTETVL